MYGPDSVIVWDVIPGDSRVSDGAGVRRAPEAQGRTVQGQINIL